MSEQDTEIVDFWQEYVDTLPSSEAAPSHYAAEQFGDNPQLADELLALILAGRKTATCSALWEWEAEGEPPPAVGAHTVVLDGAGRPRCIIETTEVTIRPYNQVDARFAYEEGEDDRSLAAWRREHWRYFNRVLPTIGRTPTAEMPLVCERFRLVYAGRIRNDANES